MGGKYSKIGHLLVLPLNMARITRHAWSMGQ